MIYFAFLYGLLTIVGGYIGYTKAGSTMSLMMGGLSGLLILASTYAVMKEKSLGYYGVIALSLLLAVFFGYRLVKTGSFMPSGMMMALSLITLIGFLIKKPEFLQGS